jgi:hypothetical protein
MKKILVIVGIVLVLVLSGIWVYILFFSAPADTTDTFSDLDIGDTTDNTIDASELAQGEPVVDIFDSEPLRQLTTKPVLGYREIVLGTSSNPSVYYVEAGTGHVFSIDLETGEEERISNTTVPDVIEAKISSDGQFVVLRKTNELLVLSFLATGDTNSFSISETVTDFNITSNNKLLYATESTAEVVAKSFDLLNKSPEKIIFTVPFRETTIAWGNSVAGPHYYYPKPSSKLLGYLYEVSNSDTKRTPVSGYGLQAKVTKDYVLFNTTEETGYLSVYNAQTENISPLYTNEYVEKCFGVWETGEFMCGISSGNQSYELEEWYAGKAIAVDNLRKINTKTLEAYPVLTVSTELRPLDIINPIYENGDVLFMDKKTNHLWLYKTSS